MSTESERVKAMKENFMSLHNEGKTIFEVAEVFGLNRRTVYAHLQEIADANNVPRQELLEVVHKPHEWKNPRMLSKKEKVDPEELMKHFNEMVNNANHIINGIDSILMETEDEED